MMYLLYLLYDDSNQKDVFVHRLENSMCQTIAFCIFRYSG